ncbi:aspartate ammonia-lyase [Faecalibacter macacae]|uniref:Aspartate ammonia-lyase n=1 Tax=Faecalibacter macacae TaxID=1859289 RepID=A0A3L9MCY8_9FLAO|nr:aspartate ammonia-lyase [Faecalibacter macacae]RLZ10533.1 aspartate ammonia-lyase [Faecalibacter macacae]
MNLYRIESDLIGELEVPTNAYYGVQTKRAVENFKISKEKLSDYPTFIQALAQVKLAAAKTNQEIHSLDKDLYQSIRQACLDVIDGQFNDQFPVDLIQGGAGTSVNMNINEVIANRALELMGYKKGEYEFCSPNDHINLAQSTNDAYPTAVKIALFQMHEDIYHAVEDLVTVFRIKGIEFQSITKMGRTQLQDAIPMTMGQEFEAFAFTLEKELKRLNLAREEFLAINMGGTAIGTGLNAPQEFPELCAKNLEEITGIPVYVALNLIESTSDTSCFVEYSSALKRLAIKLSKICNDLRLLSSGPRAGLAEITLPAMQAGSSIMPGKINPVIPEVVNQVCFKVIGNDTTIMMASEAGQLQLNVMEPIIVQTLMESIQLMTNGIISLKEKCIEGIVANKETAESLVKNSIGIVTALNPYIGYKMSTKIAKEALMTGKGVYQLVLEYELLTKSRLDQILNPQNMLAPQIV